MCEDILDFWQDVRDNPDVPWRERLKASENIMNRGYGAPQQNIDVNAQVDHRHSVSTIDAKALSQEARLQILAAVKQLPPPEPIDDAEYDLIEDNQETDESED